MSASESVTKRAILSEWVTVMRSWMSGYDLPNEAAKSDSNSVATLSTLAMRTMPRFNPFRASSSEVVCSKSRKTWVT